MSMGFHGACARREILASLRRLPPTARFQVIAYNREAEPLSIDSRSDLLTADEETLSPGRGRRVRARRRRHPPRAALRRAIAFHPDILYFLTDADDVSPDDVRTATAP